MRTLIEEYRNYAIIHGSNTQEGDCKATNRAHDKLQVIATKLINSGNGGLLFSLFDDPNTWVQLWVATHAFEIDEDRATDKLNEIAEEDSLASTSAQYTIQSWRDGELKRLMIE